MTDGADGAHTARDADAAVTAWEDPPRIAVGDEGSMQTCGGSVRLL
jgi:hypothetical protein